MKGVSLDPVTVEVIGSAVSSIVEEMGETLVRASYSTNIKERRDCSTALFDREGRTLAQAEHIPIHLGSLMGIAFFSVLSYAWSSPLVWFSLSAVLMVYFTLKWSRLQTLSVIVLLFFVGFGSCSAPAVR